jgi:glycosyltransferase involved in cell wall biosynthesis
MLLSIIVPCYNEQDTIGEVLTRVQDLDLRVPKEVIVVDDGSSDASADIVALHSSVRLIRHQKNLGKGAAIKTGIEQSRGEILLIQDADMEYFPDDIPSLVEPILRNEADLVLGSRIRGSHKGMSSSHLMGNLILSLIATVLFAKLVTDLMTGYKAVRRSVFQECIPISTGFEVEAEVVAKALDRGFRLREVPIRYEYRRTGVSKINWKYAVASIGQLLRVRIHIILVILIFALGFAIRYVGASYASANSLALDPDAQGYMSLAKGILQLSYTIPREPVFPLAATLSFLVFGPSVQAFRMTSVALGSLVILASYKLGEYASSRTAGLFLATMVALNPFLAWNSTRGLREELFSLLLICLVCHVMSSAGHLFYSKARVFDALLIIGLILTNLEGVAIALAICIFVLWYSNLRGQRQPIGYLMIVLLSTMASVLGWALFSWVQFGNPFETTTGQGSWWYAYEFGVNRRITVFEYLFGYHSSLQLALIWTRGMLRIAAGLYSLYLGSVGLVLAIIGFLYLLRFPRTLSVHLCTVVFVGSVAFFFGVSSGADFRLLYPLFPLFYSFVAAALVAISGLVSNWDRALQSHGFSLIIPVTKKLKINLQARHLCYLLLLYVILQEIWIYVNYFPAFLGLPKPP